MSLKKTSDSEQHSNEKDYINPDISHGCAHGGIMRSEGKYQVRYHSVTAVSEKSHIFDRLLSISVISGVYIIGPYDRNPN